MKLFLIISQTIYAVCLAPWLMVWMMSFMVFDNGVSFWNSLFFILISLYPVAVVVSSFIAWKLKSRRERTAIAFNLVPLLWILAFGIFMLAA